jgi:hypothetical protein
MKVKYSIPITILLLLVLTVGVSNAANSPNNFTYAAQGFADPEFGSSIVNVHHNYIHHNRITGYGYGVSNSDGPTLIKGNVFAYNRHSIASSGRPITSGYEASYNVHLKGSDTGGIFDVHECCGGGTTAGELYRIHHNTVLSTVREDVNIGGVPNQSVNINYNLFPNGSYWLVPNVSVVQRGTGNITMAYNIIDGTYREGDMIYHD